jgi:hypothetical protein
VGAGVNGGSVALPRETDLELPYRRALGAAELVAFQSGDDETTSQPKKI